MNFQPTPIMKIPNVAEIFPNKYSELTWPQGALNVSKTTKTVVQICANLIIQGGDARGSKKVMCKILKAQGLQCTYW